MVVPSNKTDKIPIRHYLKNNINILNLIIGLPLGGAVFYLILHPRQTQKVIVTGGLLHSGIAVDKHLGRVYL